MQKRFNSILLVCLAFLNGSAVSTAEPLGDESSVRSLITQESMNVFRRFAMEQTVEMVGFYEKVLGLKPLQPIDLGGGQKMIIFSIGGAQIKLAAGLKEGRLFQTGGVNDVIGIRLFTLFFPDETLLVTRFEYFGLAAPVFIAGDHGSRIALVQDPAGFSLQLVVLPDASPDVYGKVEIGINASDLENSRRFYRDFVGLDELPPVNDTLLGVTKHPYRHGDTTINIWSQGEGLPADTGSAGIQYVVSDVAAIDELGKQHNVTIEEPLGGLPGFNLRFVWLNDPDGVTNYFAQIGVRKPIDAK